MSVKYFCDICGKEIPKYSQTEPNIDKIVLNTESVSLPELDLEVCSKCYFAIYRLITKFKDNGGNLT